MDSNDEEEGPTTLPNEHLFGLNKLVSCKDIKMSARCVTERRQLLALIMGSGDITFHYQTGELNQLPVMKLVPWFLDVNKKICAICFSPDANWLVVIAHDGSIHIVPALPLVDTTASFDHRWSISDVTSFASPYLGSTVTPRPKQGWPTSIVWWQSAQEYHQTVIVGNDLGEIRFFSLTSEKQVGITYVKAAILSLHICEDNTLETVFLLITSKDRSQWKVVLEQNASSYYWSVDESKQSVSTQEVTFIANNSIDVELMSRRSSHLPTARSRLQGLKQLSVEKLASLRHKLAETRSKGIVASISDSSHSKQDGSTSSSEEIPSKLSTARDSSQYVSSGPLPERLSTQVGETYLCPQFAKDRYLLSGYYSPTSILTIHSMSLEVIPLFVYKLSENCWDILYTDKFMFITSRERNTVTVVSCVLAESRLDGDTDYNPDSIVETFTFPLSEEVLAIYKNSDLSRCSETKRASSKHKNSQQSAKFTLPKDIKDINIDAPPVDLCLIVTSAGVYEITLRQPASEIFMELVLTYQELEKAEKIAVMFGLNLQELLELAGDLKLAAEEFPQAITLYKLSRCRYLKSVLKFAAAGHTTELLSYIKVLLSTTNLDLSVSEKIHLSNLAVMSYTEQVLRKIDNKAVLLKHFLEFLGSNLSYDEVLAVNVVGQTGLWQVLQFLASYRGLHKEVLDVLGKLLRTHIATFNTKEYEDTGFKLDKWVPLLEPGLWTFITEPSLLQAMLVKAPDFRTHLRFVELCLTHLQLFALQRLAALYDPSSPLLRPNLIRMFKSPCRRLHSTSLLNSFNTDLADTVNEFIVPTEETIQMFLLVLLYLNKRQSTIHTYDPSLMDRIQITQENDEDLDDFLPSLPVQVCKLSSGFAHSALVRNGTVYTWGNAVQGCLGTGPTLSRYNPSQPVSLFPSLRLEIFSVACGRQHTLALTNNGVYSWGSSQYGQLGVGVTGQCPYPRLVERLCKEVVVSVCAGQYHSLALVKDGRVFTWGWGVHGQLGHGSIEDCHYPKLVDKLVGKVIVQVCGGHGHSLALSAEGEVYSFGSSVFGQLGTGTNLKSCVPQQVILLPERICMIATGYFHNLAVSILNKLYIWGSSPQVLRLQAQAQKKVRLLQQQPPMMSSGPEKLQLSPKKNTPVTKGTLTNLRTDLSSPETNQNNATLQIKVNNRKFPSKTVRETRNDPMSRAINNSEVDFEVYDDVYSSNSSSRTPVYTDEDSKSFNVINNSNELSDSPKMENKLENSQLLFTLPDFKENTFLNPKNGTDSIRDPFLPNLLQKCIDNKLANRTFNSEDLENIYDPNTSAQEATKISLTQYPEANHQEISSCVLKNEKTDLINGTKMSLKTENKHLIHNESSLEELQTRSNISLQKDKDSNLILPYMCLTNSDPVNISNSSNLDSLNIHSNLFPKQVVPSATPYIAVSPSVEFKGLPVLPGSATSLAANNINLNGASSPTHQYSSTSVEDGQTHLIPQLVDTSQVVGAIMQISCGCHHSALLTKEGVLYIWGRNLDGQIGNGSRREVPIPTPLSTSTANLKSLNSKTSISGAIPSIGERLRLQQVCCGSEFTTALESTGGKVWAWGSNSQGQLGKTPNEDTRELEGKLVMLKTTKRVIKLPHGSGNSNDVPKEVPGIPSTTISFRTGNFENHNWEQGSDRAAPILGTGGVCQSLCTIEFPCYGPKTLHYVLEYFHGFYDSNYIIKKSLELENYQCAAKLVTLDRQYHAAVTYQLKALALATFYPEIAVVETTSVEESKPCIHPPDHDTSFTSSHVIDNLNTDIFPNMERILERYEPSHLNFFHSNEPTCTESDDKLFSSNLGSKKCLNIFRNLDVSNKSASDESMNSDLKVKDKDTSSELSRDECSITSTPDSEMHTFSVQGGHEQMSDSNQGISTPDTSQDASHSNLSELKQKQLVYDITNQFQNISHGHKGKNTELSIELFSNSMEKCERDSLTPVPENKPISPQSHNISTNSTCGNGISEKCLKENSDKVDKTSQSNIRLSDTNTNFLSNNVLVCSNMEGLSSVTTSISQSGHSSVTRLGSAPTSDSSVKFADLMAQASLIVEFYVSMMEEDSHTMMSSLLQQGIEFWLEHSLPMDHLENVLRKHMAKFFYPLGLLLFCKAGTDSCKDENKDSKQDMSLLNNLSTKFSLQLGSTLLTHIEQKKSYPEYIDLLVQLSSIETATTASSGVSNGFCKSTSSELFSQEQMIESVLQRLGCSVHLGRTMEQPSIDLLVPAPPDGGVTPECLFVFSCGHNYSSHILQEEVLPELESRLQPLPNTARMLKEVYNTDSPSIHLACPRCLLEYLKIHTDMVM